MILMTAKSAWQDAWGEMRSTGAPSFLKNIREEGWARFEELGFPTLQHEDWRFTDVRPIAEGTFLRPNGGAPRATAAALGPLRFAGLEGPRLVFVDGRFRADLSQRGALPEGVRVSSLAAAISESPSLVEPHLARLGAESDEAFSALNAALHEDGAFVLVPDGVEVPGAVHALYVTAAHAEPVMTHPRSLFVVGRAARATFVEDHATLGEGPVFTNPVTEVVVGETAAARHYLLQRSNDRSYCVSTLWVNQKGESDFASHSALFGGQLVRNNVFPTLNGPRCHSVLNGMYLPRGAQLHDNRMRVRHAAPGCRSRQYYRGIIADKAKAMFTGRIVVDEGAQQTDAVQSNKNILLSPDALVETKPQLEIYADDVKCTHGATVGQIDDLAMFYCRTRGIPPDAARRLLVSAFVHEILDRMELEPVRERLSALVAERLAEV
jgi:Fe-S cluster assembly protein SufD